MGDWLEQFILVIAIIILSLLNYLYLNRRKWKNILIWIFIPVSLFIIVVMLRYFYQADIIHILKRVSIVAVLWTIAISDYKEYRIPNKLILLGIVIRALILIYELVINLNSVLSILIYEFIAVAGAVIVCLICMVISRGSLGMGDLKLMIPMGLMLGVEGICYAMFVSVFFAFIVSVFLLLTKRKVKSDQLPFAPFILAGTFASIILSGI